MFGNSGGKAISDNLREHPAVRAWCLLGPRHAEPYRVDVLKAPREGKSDKSAAYRLAGVGLDGAAVVAKQCRANTAAVERFIYEQVLLHLPVSQLRYYGSLDEPEAQMCWLFIEDASGAPYSPQVAEHRSAAARWLGRLHMAAHSLQLADALPDRGPDHYRAHMHAAGRAIRESLANPAVGASDREILLSILLLYERLELMWSRLEAFCRVMPDTLVHGDFAGKHIRLREDRQGTAVLAFDWEFAGWGVPAGDLAQAEAGVMRFSANPDIHDYWAAVQDWHAVDQGTIGQLANVGTIFRVLAAIDWITQDVTSRWLPKVVGHLAAHEPALRRAIGTAEWSR